jgi:hypothetical protein
MSGWHKALYQSWDSVFEESRAFFIMKTHLGLCLCLWIQQSGEREENIKIK